MGLSFGSKIRGIRQAYQVGLPFKRKAEVSGETIRWDYHLEAIAEVPGGHIKCIYHFAVKVKVSDGTIRWDYLLEIKQRYQVELSDGITIWKQWRRYQVGLSGGITI